jgi:hypothetical protein
MGCENPRFIALFVNDSAVTSQPYPSGHITADKRKIKDFPKLPSVISFIRETLGDIATTKKNYKHIT